MQHDETLLGVSEKVKNFAIICAYSYGFTLKTRSIYASLFNRIARYM